MTDQTILDRKRGTLLGLAVGDALGAAVEFMRPGSFEPVRDYRGGGPHGLGPGEWTDDTSMALALANSIATAGWNLDDQARQYCVWWREGRYSVTGRCFDIGNTTVSALRRFEHCGDAKTSGESDEHACGNGSIMRLAPVPIYYAYLFPEQIAELARLAMESSITTHAHPRCLSACAYFSLVLCGLMHGEPRDEVLSDDWPPLAELRQCMSIHPDIDEIAKGSYKGKQPPEIKGSGYVVKSLEAALWAFHDADSFSQAVLRSVNLGDDADTTAAVCGQLAGAWWGESGIPQHWLNNLAHRDMIEQALAGLFKDS